GQESAVAEAARTVDDHDLAIAFEPQVLQAVVGKDQLHTARDQGARSRDPVGTHHRRTAGTPAEYQGLIAHFLPWRRRGHEARLTLGVGAVTARYDPHLETAGAELARQPDRQRRLAGATHREIADHHHRPADRLAVQPARAVRAAAYAHDGAVEPR